MPLCSECSNEKARTEFTKAQLRKPDATRRCKSCVTAEQSREEMAQRQDEIRRGIERTIRQWQEDEEKKEGDNSQRKDDFLSSQRRARFQQPPPPPPIQPLRSFQMQAAVKQAISVAVIRILRSGVPRDVGLDGFGQRELEARLWEVFNNEYIWWLGAPFLQGLANRDGMINQKVCPNPQGEAQPILHWLCQYQFFQAQMNYQGKDDIVALALQAGADVHMEASNKCTALFFAVKYSSVRTVELLLDAGTKIDQRDIYGQSIWKNVVERPNPRIVELILKRCSNLIPVDKEVVTVAHSGKTITYNMPDHMLGLWNGMLKTTEFSESTIPISWEIVGTPQVDDIITSLIRVMQAGARFSATNDLLPEELLADHLSITTHIDFLQDAIPVQQQVEITRSLRDAIYGRYLPESMKQEVHEAGCNISHVPDATCLICLTEMESSDVPVTLYCGHRYCLECIKAYGAAPLNQYQIQKGTEKRCPACRRLVGGDFLTPDYIEDNRAHRIRLGIDRHEASEQLHGPRGPHLLTDEQLRFECKAVLNKTEGTREELLQELKTVMFSTGKLGTSKYYINSKTIDVDMDKGMVELTATRSVVLGAEKPTMIIAPMRGPVVVPIKVKGIPILASLSPNSFVTVVPQCIVETFGLKTKPISSSQFISLLENQILISAVVDEFKFLLGDVEICLNNAIVLAAGSHNIRSIQLGMDFFESAVWTRCCTRVAEGDVFVVTDGGYTRNMFIQNQADELRYYSRDGKICQLPFIHIRNLDKTELIPIVSLPGDKSIQFGECQWCCRYFPCDGMLKCENDDRNFRYYCDEECKARGMAVCTGKGDSV